MIEYLHIIMKRSYGSVLVELLETTVSSGPKRSCESFHLRGFPPSTDLVIPLFILLLCLFQHVVPSYFFTLLVGWR